MSKVFKNKEGVLPKSNMCKAHCCYVHTKIIKIFTVNPLCVPKLNKLVFNQYLMFRFINISPKSSNVSLVEGNDV